MILYFSVQEAEGCLQKKAYARGCWGGAGGEPNELTTKKRVVLLRHIPSMGKNIILLRVESKQRSRVRMYI
jgi:hypothetical protein